MKKFERFAWLVFALAIAVVAVRELKARAVRLRDQEATIQAQAAEIHALDAKLHAQTEEIATQSEQLRKAADHIAALIPLAQGEVYSFMATAIEVTEEQAVVDAAQAWLDARR